MDAGLTAGLTADLAAALLVGARNGRAVGTWITRTTGTSTLACENNTSGELRKLCVNLRGPSAWITRSLAALAEVHRLDRTV